MARKKHSAEQIVALQMGRIRVDITIDLAFDPMTTRQWQEGNPGPTGRHGI